MRSRFAAAAGQRIRDELAPVGLCNTLPDGSAKGRTPWRTVTPRQLYQLCTVRVVAVATPPTVATNA